MQTNTTLLQSAISNAYNRVHGLTYGQRYVCLARAQTHTEQRLITFDNAVTLSTELLHPCFTFTKQ